MTQPLSIHTIEARGNVALEVAQKTFALSPIQMRQEIGRLIAEVRTILTTKGIEYDDLRNALTPQTDRRDIALIFDTTQVADSFYGLAIASAYLPLFPLEASISVLEGDLLGRHPPGSWLHVLLEASLIASGNSYEWRLSNQFFCVYVHSLTDQQTATLIEGLRSFQPFIGSLDLTFGSRIRNYLSTILVARYIKHRDIAILGHEDEFSDSPDTNILGYPFEARGLKVRSIRPTYYGICLAYKIERSGVKADTSDIQMSLNAISATLADLGALEITIADPKFEHLRSKKQHAIAGVAAASKDDFAEAIREKLEEGYIYNLSYLAEHNVSKFNLLLEFEGATSGDPLRLLVAFEYLPEARALRLITAY